MAEYAIFVRLWEGWTPHSPAQRLDMVPPEGGAVHREVRQLAELLAREYPAEVEAEAMRLAREEGRGAAGGPPREPEAVEVVGRVFNWFCNPVRAFDLAEGEPLPEEGEDSDDHHGPRIYAKLPRFRVTTWEPWQPGIPDSAEYLAVVKDERIAALAVATTPVALRDRGNAIARLGFQRLDELPASLYMAIKRKVAQASGDGSLGPEPSLQSTLEILSETEEEKLDEMVKELALRRASGHGAGTVLPKGWSSPGDLQVVLERLGRSGGASGEHANSQRSSSEGDDLIITHSPDFSWLRIGKDVRYDFPTVRQRQVIAALHAAWKTGGDGAWMTEAAIVEELDGAVQRGRFARVFKDAPALGSIVKRREGKEAAWALFLDERGDQK